LKVTPLVTLEFESYKHKRSKVNTSVPSIKPIPIKRLNSKNKKKFPSTKESIKSAISSEKSLLKLTRNITPDFNNNKISSKNYASYSIDKQCQFNFLQMLADISDTVNTLHALKSTTCQPLDIALHSGHHVHIYISDYAYHTYYNHHSVIDIPIPPYKPPTQPTI